VRKKAAISPHGRTATTTASSAAIDSSQVSSPLSTPLTDIDLALPTETPAILQPIQTDNSNDALDGATNKRAEVSLALLSPNMKETYISPSPKRLTEELAPHRGNKKRRTGLDEQAILNNGARTRSERRRRSNWLAQVTSNINN
jgi:hypothetical protein